MSIRFREMLVLCCLMVFIVFVSTRDNYIDVSMEDIKSAVSEAADFSGMEEFGNSQLKKDFGINANDYEGVIYYGHQSVMDCEKVLIIKLSDSSQGKDLAKSVKEIRTADMDMFRSYAPDQYKLLDECVIEQKGNYFIYVVSDNARAVEKAFTGCITG